MPGTLRSIFTGNYLLPVCLAIYCHALLWCGFVEPRGARAFAGPGGCILARGQVDRDPVRDVGAMISRIELSRIEIPVEDPDRYQLHFLSQPWQRNRAH